MGEQRTDNDDLPAETKRKRWRNYQERVRADGGVSRFINPTIDGKQRWVQIPDEGQYRGKRGYERFLRETLAEAADRATNIHFDDAAAEWLSAYSRSKAGTVDSYRRHIALHLNPAFGALALKDITAAQLTQFVTEKMAAGLTLGYVKRMVWIFRAIFDPYVDAGRLKRHPGKVKIRYRQAEVTGTTLDAVDEDRRGGRALTVEEVHLLIDNIYPSYRLMVALMVWTGLRIGEALAMQWRYLDTDKGLYHVERNLNRRRQLGTPKTAASRAPVTLSTYIVAWLERHRGEQAAERLRTPHWQDHDLIFASCGKWSPHPGAPRSYAPCKEALARGAARAGIGHVRLHDLRHTCATLLIQKHRCNIKEVSIHLRHTNPAITQAIYGHLYPDDLPAMARAMDTLLLGVK